MIVIIVLFLLVPIVVLNSIKSKRQNDKIKNLLEEEYSTINDSLNLINLKALKGKNYFHRFRDSMKTKFDIIGFTNYYIYWITPAIIFGAIYTIQKVVLGKVNIYVAIVLPIFIIYLLFTNVLQKRRQQFEEQFPDALNLVANAVTAGESITSAIQYAGETIRGRVGNEFLDMVERMNLGEPIEKIFERSTKRLPYPSYIFFIVVLKSNIDKGGQIKEILKTLSSVITTARIVYKKKMAMTSEARISAKIVSAIPALFLVYMYFLSRTNLEYVLHDPRGNYILYYVIGSELLGLGITWWLIKGVDK